MTELEQKVELLAKELGVEFKEEDGKITISHPYHLYSVDARVDILRRDIEYIKQNTPKL